MMVWDFRSNPILVKPKRGLGLRAQGFLLRLIKSLGVKGLGKGHCLGMEGGFGHSTHVMVIFPGQDQREAPRYLKS